MSGYLTPLRVEAVDAVRWKLLDDFQWQGSQGDVFIIPAGAYTDFATVPWWTQSLIPKTGTWTKAAVVHDKMCDDLNAHHKAFQAWWSSMQGVVKPPEKPLFSSVDTDAIFRKNARAEGTGWIRGELLWLGVRWGALANPARRAGWLSTAPRVIAGSAAVLALLAIVIVLAALVLP